MCKQLYKGAKAEAFLALFDNDKTLQDIERYRYVDGLTIEQTAMMVGYSERQINRFCKKIKEIAEGKIKQPISDMVEVVRCKNCLHCKPTAVDGVMACIRNSKYIKPNDYCSLGERKRG